VHYAAQYGWFVALTLIPLAQVVALEFTMPIWSAARAVAFLGERMNRWKVLAVALGLAGVAVIVRPAATGLNPGQGVALAAAVGFAVSVVLVKSLTRTDTAIQVSFGMLVVQSVIGLVPALLVWQWPSARTWGWVVVVAFCGTFSHYCFARAMQHADATVVVPMDFLRVPLTAAAGWAVYAERVDLFTALGVALISGSTGTSSPRASSSTTIRLSMSSMPPPARAAATKAMPSSIWMRPRTCTMVVVAPRTNTHSSNTRAPLA